MGLGHEPEKTNRRASETSDAASPRPPSIRRTVALFSDSGGIGTRKGESVLGGLGRSTKKKKQ